MKLDIALFESEPRAAAEAARGHEASGLDGAFTFDGPHDPFLPLAHAAVTTERLTLGTAVAIAFGRNPMLCAQTANDLQTASRGRFVLGLGTQVRAHIERRYGQPWSRPHERMREFVQAIRAIWRSWNEGERLDFRGVHYTHTLMPPLFNPGPNAFGTPQIWLAGFGPRMVEVAGEVGDGWLVHPLNTPSYVAEVALPALERGFERAGRVRSAYTIACQTLVMTGNTPAEIAIARGKARAQVAFYSATPAYRPLLDHHGWGGLGDELVAMARAGRWLEMIERIDDDVLSLVGVSGRPDEIGPQLRARNEFADRTMIVLYNEAGPDAVARIAGSLGRFSVS